MIEDRIWCVRCIGMLMTDLYRFEHGVHRSLIYTRATRLNCYILSDYDRTLLRVTLIDLGCWSQTGIS